MAVSFSLQTVQPLVSFLHPLLGVFGVPDQTAPDDLTALILKNFLYSIRNPVCSIQKITSGARNQYTTTHRRGTAAVSRPRYCDNSGCFPMGVNTAKGVILPHRLFR